MRIDLLLGGLKVASTYATPGVPMSGVRGSGERKPGLLGGGEPTRMTYPWQKQPVVPPTGDTRNSMGQIRTFSLQIQELWQYASPSTRLVVNVAGRSLPIYGHGMFLTPPETGKFSLDVLRKKLAGGYLLTQTGRILLSRRLDTEWQKRVSGLYERVRERIAASFGYDVFLMYGTLLGVVRDGGYINHDADFDSAYISRFRTGPEAAAELVDIALSLRDAGLIVDMRERLLHVHDPERPGFRIDLFHLFFDRKGQLRFPWGIAGTSRVRKENWKGTRRVEFPGGAGLIPVDSERMVATLYGNDWRQPKPGFNWSLSRVDSEESAFLSEQQRTKVYWANFYAEHGDAPGSSFFEFVQSRGDTPARVIDIGCGDGRDALTFAGAGRTVLGLDQSSVGIQHATKQAIDAGLGDRVRFAVCDVSHAAELRSAVHSFLTGDPEPVMFYLRFFLHAIHADAQKVLLDTLSRLARPGDQLAAEFRTDKDENTAKVYTNHYRRFQNAAQFRSVLETKYKFTVLFDVESAGLSPYQDEDPVLYRVIARR